MSFNRIPEHGSFIAWKASICREPPQHLRCSETIQGICITHMYTQLYPLTKHPHKEPGWTTKEPGFGSRQAKRISVFQSVKTGCGAHTPSHQMDTGVSWPREKQPSREADHSPHLVPIKRMLGALTSLLQTSSWNGSIINSVRNNLTLLHTHIYIYSIYIRIYLYTTNDINRS